MINKENQVALQLGSEGARVYVTGRRMVVFVPVGKIGRIVKDWTRVTCVERCKLFTGRSREALEDLAEEIKGRGGEAIVSVCDHADVAATEALFHKIEQMV